VTPQDAARLNAASGLDDAAPVFAEDFIQWVIEDRFCAGRPDLESVGVQFTQDVNPYEQVKLRMLNASHVMMAYPGTLMGHRLVHLAMRDPAIDTLLGQFLNRDARPLLNAPPGMGLGDYAAMLLTRFRNPAIGDQMLRLCSDGGAKLPIFIQDTARAILARGGEHRRIALLLAAFAEYLGGRDDHGAEFPVVEPQVSRADFALARAADPAAALGMSAFKGWGLADHAGFTADFCELRRSIRASGAAATLQTLLAAVGSA
jgi:mannitol 2-dehydrogenase